MISGCDTTKHASSSSYNKTRQLVITQELAEISSAFNVLNILKQKREQSED